MERQHVGGSTCVPVLRLAKFGEICNQLLYLRGGLSSFCLRIRDHQQCSTVLLPSDLPLGNPASLHLYIFSSPLWCSQPCLLRCLLLDFKVLKHEDFCPVWFYNLVTWEHLKIAGVSRRNALMNKWTNKLLIPINLSPFAFLWLYKLPEEYQDTTQALWEKFSLQIQNSYVSHLMMDLDNGFHVNLIHFIHPLRGRWKMQPQWLSHCPCLFNSWCTVGLPLLLFTFALAVPSPWKAFLPISTGHFQAIPQILSSHWSLTCPGHSIFSLTFSSESISNRNKAYF